MGGCQTRAANVASVSSFRTYQFKLFEYVCPNCKERRTVQYFYRAGAFLPQSPQVVCGNCRRQTVNPRDIFKTVDFICPECNHVRKARLPARPAALEKYESSVVSCDRCFFRGEVRVGRFMETICEGCCQSRRHLASVWTENGSSLKVHCQNCNQTTTQVALNRPAKRAPSSGASDDGSTAESGSETVAAPRLRMTCGECLRELRPITAEDLIKNRGVCACSRCGWRGCPDDVEAERPTPAPGTGRSRSDEEAGPQRQRKSWKNRTRPPNTD